MGTVFTWLTVCNIYILQSGGGGVICETKHLCRNLSLELLMQGAYAQGGGRNRSIIILIL